MVRVSVIFVIFCTKLAIGLRQNSAINVEMFTEDNCIQQWKITLQRARGKSGPALAGTEYQLMPSAYRLIVRACRLTSLISGIRKKSFLHFTMRRRSIVVV